LQRTRVELPHRVPELVHLALSGPHQRLVRPREHLDRSGELAVAGDLPMVVPIGAHHIGQHLGITRIGLGARGGVAVPVPRDRERVDRVDPVARREHRSDEQTTVDLDADHDLGRLPRVLGHHGVQPADSFHAIGHPPLGQDVALMVEHAHVVVRLGPVDANEDHDSSFRDR